MMYMKKRLLCIPGYIFGPGHCPRAYFRTRVLYQGIKVNAMVYYLLRFISKTPQELPKMLQKYRKCKIKYLLKPPFTPVYDPPPPAPCICSSSSPCTSQWECFASNQCYNTFFRLHKKDIPAKKASKAQKMQKSGTYKSPILPQYLPPWAPPTPPSKFFWSLSKAWTYVYSPY